METEPECIGFRGITLVKKCWTEQYCQADKGGATNLLPPIAAENLIMFKVNNPALFMNSGSANPIHPLVNRMYDL